jgi:hypothetical protein
MTLTIASDLDMFELVLAVSDTIELDDETVFDDELDDTDRLEIVELEILELDLTSSFDEIELLTVVTLGVEVFVNEATAGADLEVSGFLVKL